jgi:flotillin
MVDFLLDPSTLIVGGFALVAMIFFSTIILLKSNYKRCSSNQVLVIFGKTRQGQAAKTVHGGAAFVWPLIQDYHYLSLEPIQIEIPLRGALSMENIRVNVPSVFTVAIGTAPEVMTNAAIRLLDLTTQDIRKQAEEIIFGQLRQVIASMKITDINTNRDTFLEHIQNSVEPELKKIGLVLINVNITDITDESGYIDAIGQKAASQAIQQARGDVAEEEKQGEVRVAQANRERAIQVASATKEQQIGTRDAEREQAIRIAEMAKLQSVGEQTAAYARDTEIKQAEQLMRITVAQANATAVEGENLSEAKIAQSQATLLTQRADAYQRGESRKREAEAAVMEVQNRALAKAALAEAEKIEAEQRAKVEAPAKALKAKIVVDAEAEAERIRLEAAGEAAAIYAKLEAEARGQYEILAKKGEGLKMIVEACGGAKEAFQLMMLEHLDTLAESSAKAISNIKFDKIIVWENGGQNGRSSTADFLHKMAGTLPPMMQVMRDIGGIEIPESLAKLVGNSESAEPAGEVVGNGRMPSAKQPTTAEPK